MKTVNSLSGGKTSSYLAMNYPVDYNIFSLVCIDDKKCTPSDKNMIKAVNDKFEKYGYLEKYGEFIATAEDDKILKIMFDLEQMLGSEIVWVRHNSFDKLIDKKQMLPNLSMRYCTSEMKIIPICEWVVNEVMKKEDMQPVFMNMGIRIDEENRAKKGKKREYNDKIIVGKTKSGKLNSWQSFFWAVANYPLINDRISHYSIQQYWKDKDIIFPDDSNCVGCFWKDAQQLRKNWEDSPEKMEWFSKQEEKDFRYKGGFKKHFFKSGISYESIKEIGVQQDFFSGTGSGCNAGFCTD